MTTTDSITSAADVADAPSNGLEASRPEHITFTTTFRSYPAEGDTHGDLGLYRDGVVALYRDMLLQRRFEERAAQMYGKQKIGGFLHLYNGQEAISTGSAQALNMGLDTVITAYRDHGLALAVGMEPGECMAELFGRIDGCSQGKGGSMHFFSREKGMYGGHGIVGAHIPLATGIAFAHKYKRDGGICVCYLGDGAVWQGAFHEALNLAGLYKLPVIYVIENNQYAMGTSVERAAADVDLYKQSVSYAMPGSLVNGMDVFSVMRAMRDHADMARRNQPSVVEIRTYRYRGHSMSDPGKYRTREELEKNKDQDPILRLKAYLLREDLANESELAVVDRSVKREVLEAVDFAARSPQPPLEAIYDHVYTEEGFPFLQ